MGDLKSRVRRGVLSAALVLVLLPVAACSGAGSDDAAEARAVAEVCGGFAEEGPAREALTALVGDAGDVGDLGDVGLVDDRSRPDDTLRALKEADGTLSPSELANGSPFCRLRRAGEAESLLDITFREALTVPRAGDEQTFRRFRTGASAESSSRYAKLFFPCRRPSEARELIVAAELERSGESVVKGDQDPAALQITVLNAAARVVAARLGCGATGLVDGRPVPVPVAG
ncbi:hypothetical protein [Streptomyces sp. NPDC090025]|uniref:hypothetical protein n=1 Tax=Streptomyces sp. NPDC090025 TaxID=3365922 RepID=UPI00383967FE